MPDLKVDLKQLIGQKIRVSAIGSYLGEHLLISDPVIEFDMNSIMVQIEDLPRESRKWIVTNCSEQCRVVVDGEVIANAGLGPGLRAGCANSDGEMSRISA